MAGRKQEILDAALELADDKGLEAVSMRALAERAGVTPMALYPHVGSKGALLDGMLGRVVAQMVSYERPAWDSAADWQERLRVLMRGARQLAHRHPWAAALVFSRPSATSDSAAGVDLFYTTLLEAGIPRGDVPRLERLVTTLAVGYGASEVGGRFAGTEGYVRARRGELGDAPLPGHKSLTRWLEQPVDWDTEFEADVDDVIGLVEAVAARGSVPGEQ